MGHFLKNREILVHKWVFKGFENEFLVHDWVWQWKLNENWYIDGWVGPTQNRAYVSVQIPSTPLREEDPKMSGAQRGEWAKKGGSENFYGGEAAREVWKFSKVFQNHYPFT